MTGLLHDALTAGLGRRRREVAVVSSLQELRSIRAEWEHLFLASGTSNPFAHPTWLTAWAAYYVEEGDLCVVTVREDGQLAAVAPFYRARRSPMPNPLARTLPHARILRLLGMGRGNEITELPEILTLRPDPALIRAVVQALLDVEGWDWFEVTLTPEQGWFDGEWIDPAGERRRATAFHKWTRAAVVAPLAPTWDLFRTGLGRNVRESIRRGENRLRRAGHEWRVSDEFADEHELAGALDQVITLHRARAAADRGPAHVDQLGDECSRDFLVDAVRQLGADGHATPAVLEVDGAAIAARLLLHANRTTFFSLSGFDPRWWDFGVATTLMAELLRRRIARGDVLANLSLSPDRPKLRWSRELRLHHDFAVVRAERRARVIFRAFWIARAAASGRSGWSSSPRQAT